MGSTLSENALKSAAYLARASRGKIKLVRVCAGPLGSDYPVDVSVRRAIEEQECLRCANYLEHQQRKLTEQGIRCEMEVLHAGDPAERILEQLEDEETDLVVLSSHGRTGVTRVLLGSVAEKVARYAPCPVLIVGGRTPMGAVTLRAASANVRAEA